MDTVCWRCIEESNLLSKPEMSSVHAWWQRERTEDEGVAAFLIRCGVFHRNALTELDLIVQGYARFGAVSHLFTPNGFALLRRCAAGLPDATPCPQPTNDTEVVAKSGDTVSDEPPEHLRLSPTVTLGTLPIVRPDGGTISAPVSNESLIGLTIGNCRLQRFLGRGFKSLVFAAEELPTKRPLAIKVLSADAMMRGAIWKQRFLHEAKLASRFDHSLLLSVERTGEDADYVYSTMPLMNGGSSRETLRAQGPYGEYEATRIALELAHALEVLHGRSIQHGNLKPSNVFVTQHGGVKLADASPPLAPSSRVCQTQPLRAAEVACDIRMLAATWHWLLTAKPPGQRELRETIGGYCDAILQRALWPEKGHGYVSIRELAADLKKLAERMQQSNARSSESVALSSSIPDAGQVLGKCLLTERVGAGSRGIVFRARHLTLNVQVAVKVLFERGRQRPIAEIRNEAMILARLHHPHIVRVWDYLEEGDHSYLVLDFVEGVNLAQLIRQSGRLQQDRAVAIVAQVASALEAAYKIGVVHRDVKPGNILLARDGCVRLADFGLAFIAGEPRSSDTAGTFGYMSPEQQSDPGGVDHRADIYSLGITLYHLITGRLPADLNQIQSIPDVDPCLCEVIWKMTAFDRVNRYQSYDDLLVALAALRCAAAANDSHLPGRRILDQRLPRLTNHPAQGGLA
jgi:serine/threonine protein kinase